MNNHPYLRAYLSGIAFPTFALLGFMSIYTVLRYVYNVSAPVERFIIFPLAVVPNLWGAWNVLYVARIARRISLGLFGGVLPLLLAPLGYGVARLLDFPFPSIVTTAFPFVFPAVLVMYYFVWKHLVGFLNRELGVT
jgi:hypothetical protein